LAASVVRFLRCPRSTSPPTPRSAALARAGVEGAQIGQVVMGHVINTEPRDMYLSRVMAMNAGIPETTPR
jgi:acetyl-CoA C-acetyltransferase